jgi:hypothetical protein
MQALAGLVKQGKGTLAGVTQSGWFETVQAWGVRLISSSADLKQILADKIPQEQVMPGLATLSTSEAVLTQPFISKDLGTSRGSTRMRGGAPSAPYWHPSGVAGQAEGTEEGTWLCGAGQCNGGTMHRRHAWHTGASLHHPPAGVLYLSVL